MSLWEKWEREKMERMGVKVERKSDVEIHDAHPKPNLRKQARIVAGAVAACLLVVYLALVINAMLGGSWSDWYIVRVFAEKEAQRMSTVGNQ